MTLRDSYVQTLETQNDELRGRIEQLEELLGMRIEAPIEFGFTGAEARLFGLLTRVELVTKEKAMFALYATRIDAEPEIKIIDVFVCKMRKKLEPYKIEINTVWGQGYRLSPETKARVRQMLDPLEAAE